MIRCGATVISRLPPPELSIVIPMKGQAAYTYQCLQTLQESCNLNYEVIIYDSPSNDRFNPDVVCDSMRLIVEYNQDQYIGMYELLNKAVSRASGSIVAIINNDIVLGHHCMDNLVYAIKNYGLQSVYPAAIGDSGELPHTFFERAKAASETPCSLVGPPEWRGWFIMVTRSNWDELGGFDPKYLLNVGDNDFFMRMYRNGTTSRCVSNAIAHHFLSKTPRSTWIQQQDDFDHFVSKWGHQTYEHTDYSKLMPQLAKSLE